MTTTIPGATRLSLIAAFAGLTLLNGCVINDEVTDEADAEASYSNGNIVTSWATIAADAIVRPDEASAALRSPGPSGMLGAGPARGLRRHGGDQSGSRAVLVLRLYLNVFVQPASRTSFSILLGDT